MNIYVSNLSFNVQDEDLKSYFADYGEVTSAKVINDKETGRSRGFGFVEMSDDAAAQKAIAELDGATVDGRAIKVSVAKPREERSVVATTIVVHSPAAVGKIMINDKRKVPLFSRTFFMLFSLQLVFSSLCFLMHYQSPY